MKYYETPLSKALMIIFSLVCAAFFALPLLWLLTAPFNRFTTLSVDLPSHPTLDNFQRVFDNQFAIRALFRNNLIIAGGAMSRWERAARLLRAVAYTPAGRTCWSTC
jgi:multiple sugar transport system permease protein